MFRRQTFIALAFSTSVASAMLSPITAEASSAFKTQAETAKELFDAGMKQYKSGDLKAAQKTLRLVDGLQLPRQDRLLYYQTLEAVERQLQNPAKPAVKPKPAVKKPAVKVKPVAKPKPAVKKPVVNTKPAVKVKPPVKVKPAAPKKDIIAQAKRIRVQELLAEAQLLETKGSTAAAMTRYKQVLGLDKANKVAQANLKKLQTQASDAATGSLIDNFQRQQAVQRGKVEADFNTFIQLAKEKAGQNNYAGALNNVHQALISLENNSGVFEKAQYNKLFQDGQALATTLERQKLEHDADLRKQRAKELQIKNAKAVAEQEKRTFQQIQRLLRRTYELQKEQRYDEALELARQALTLDPTNAAAQLVEEVLFTSKL